MSDLNYSNGACPMQCGTVRCPEHTIHFMGFGYGEYIRNLPRRPASGADHTRPNPALLGPSNGPGSRFRSVWITCAGRASSGRFCSRRRARRATLGADQGERDGAGVCRPVRGLEANEEWRRRPGSFPCRPPAELWRQRRRELLALFCWLRLHTGESRLRTEAELRCRRPGHNPRGGYGVNTTNTNQLECALLRRLYAA